jgi:hypothetical protein
VDPTNFQVNGTIIFETSGEAQALADEVVRLLTPVCGYDDAVLVRPADWVLELDLGTGLETGLETDARPPAEVSFFDGPEPFPEQLPWEVPGAGLTVLRADSLHAVSLDDIEMTSGATWALERRLGVPVTSRGVGTMTRLRARLLKLGADR